MKQKKIRKTRKKKDQIILEEEELVDHQGEKDQNGVDKKQKVTKASRSRSNSRNKKVKQPESDDEAIE